ncbi:MAG TPA: urea ABC transporter permease subunit UrtB, partial [Rhodovulum sp.]|nr:urea ABC transporter permease subunit UrtB [Rhodovulum sp.]
MSRRADRHAHPSCRPDLPVSRATAGAQDIAADGPAATPLQSLLQEHRAAIEHGARRGIGPAIEARRDSGLPEARLERLLTISFDPDPDARIAAIEGFAGDIGVDMRAALNPLMETTRAVAPGEPPAGENITRRLSPGREALPREAAYAMLVEAGLASPRIGRAEIRAALAAHSFYDRHAEADPRVTETAADVLSAIALMVGGNQMADLALDALPLAFAITFGAGVAMERLVIRWLYNRPLETLLATFGISIALQKLAKNIFGTQARPLTSPAWLDGSRVINHVVSISYIRIAIFVLALMFLALFLFIMRRTRLGLEVRAVTQNPRMAASM